uniref:Citreohybridonol synthase n=1 Tax=Emericella variicolor TaxID=1549217 RepID=A0A1L7NQ47_EMEVA|nr:citreohybridonol synthase [Aspergillus stellatus]
MISNILQAHEPSSTLLSATLAVVAVWLLKWLLIPASNLPIVNEKSILQLGQLSSRKSYVAGAADLLKQGFAKSAKGFRLITDNGCQIVISPKYLEEIRQHPDLSRDKASARELMSHLPGFEVFREGSKDERILHVAVLTKLTRTLGRVTEHLSHETALSFQKHWTDEQEWHAIPLRSSITQIIAQTSSRVFLGEKLCRDPAWLHITINYASHVIQATEKLRQWPHALRYLVHWVLPTCRRLRQDMRDALDLIIPIIEERKQEKAAALAAGKDPVSYSDAIDWMEDTAKGRPYNPAISQLLLSMAAIHTSADMLTQVLFDIASRPELLKALHEEIMTVVRENGWSKISLYKLVLMDSTIKESQRLKPIAITPMRRLATKDVRLSDGMFIPKNTTILFPADAMWDPDFYENPNEFDPYRYIRMRKLPNRQAQTEAQLVSPSPNHLGWGFGEHACPGRFFAANELKIALTQILLKYDLKLDEERLPEVRRHGTSRTADPVAKLVIRRRQDDPSVQDLPCMA